MFASILFGSRKAKQTNTTVKIPTGVKHYKARTIPLLLSTCQDAECIFKSRKLKYPEDNYTHCLAQTA